jgi:putative ABC transport system substrate-binding protein
VVIRRRRFLVTLAAGALAGGRRASAQPRVPRVGVVSGGARSFEALKGGLRDAGYVIGQMLVIEHRRTEGRAERYHAAVAAVLDSGVDVIVVFSNHGITAARALSRTVPIVAVDLETDPVASGFVTSLARPGGNLTGVFLDLPEITGKLLQILKESVAGLTRVGAVHDALIGRPQLQATEAAGRAIDVTIHPAPVRSAGDLPSAVESAARDGARALVVLPAPLMRINQARIDELALRSRLPSITLFSLLPNGSGFMSYGPDVDEIFRRSASYVDRILKGAAVGMLPVERPSKFEFAVNLRTARALKLALPQPLLMRADRVID